MVTSSYRCPKCHHEDKWQVLKQHMSSCCPDQPFTQLQLRINDPYLIAKQEQKKARRAKCHSVRMAEIQLRQAESRKPCHYHFAGPGYGCHHGDRCRFSHAAVDDPRIHSNSATWSASQNPPSNGYGTGLYLPPPPPPPPPSSWVAGPSLPPRQEGRPDDRTTSILPPGGYGELLLARMRNQEGTGTGTGGS